MNQDWTFDSEPDPTVEFREVSNDIRVLIPGDHKERLVFYSQGQEVGFLDLSDGVMKFQGKMDESAASFLIFVKQMFDNYVQLQRPEVLLEKEIKR